MGREIGGGSQLEATRQLGRAHAPRQLQKSERIATGLSDDPVEDAVVESARDNSRQQGDACRAQ
jgi:hypothetical protein